MANVHKGKRAGHQFRHAGALQAPAGFDNLVRASVGPDGPVALWASATDRVDILGGYEDPGGSTFPATRTSSRPRVALAAHSARTLVPEHCVIVDELPVAHPHVQPMPYGEFVVVGGRCELTPEGPEQNALLVGSDGTIKRKGTIGDGIEEVLVDSNGEIWIGYFDEGIFGNFGWGGWGKEPLGAAGIVRWSSGFEKLWEYEAVDKYWIADCYALNVGPDQTWACPYAGFPILQINSDSTTIRRTTGVSGPRGLVIAGESVALIGDYEYGGSLLLGTLGELSHFKRSELGMQGRRRRVADGTLVCRGSVANLFVGADWFIYDLAEAT